GHAADFMEAVGVRLEEEQRVAGFFEEGLGQVFGMGVHHGAPLASGHPAAGRGEDVHSPGERRVQGRPWHPGLLLELTPGRGTTQSESERPASVACWVL